ncbi:hypothetical protein I540_4168 [Mycobacteroides abscessus subsp. bolletii 1513]|uniref:Thiol-disulfide oxidoreductase n=6 Tax=Mycobacteroides abscessus TaxID=36809 RepID=X8DJD4_9MYCO|nr:hypothetical protein I540_4168 [Mycobacteroides abscessus subsp. bolletii 1513]
MNEQAPVLLYDGVCALCNGAVKKILRDDKVGSMRFAALDSEYGTQVIDRHPELAGVDSFVIVDNPGGPDERTHIRSDAVLRVIDYLGGARRASLIGRLVPARSVTRCIGWWHAPGIACSAATTPARCRLPRSGRASWPKSGKSEWRSHRLRRQRDPAAATSGTVEIWPTYPLDSLLATTPTVNGATLDAARRAPVHRARTPSASDLVDSIPRTWARSSRNWARCSAVRPPARPVASPRAR